MPEPNLRRNTYHYHYSLDVSAMAEGAAFLLGEHDFKSFASIHGTAETTVRTIYEAAVTAQDGVITIRLTGSGFLYNMVRIIAGTLIEVGAGKRSPKDIRSILEARDREAAGPTAPAKGLTMIRIEIL